MKFLSTLCIAPLCLLSSWREVSVGQGKDYPIKAVPFTDVQVKDEFWSPRIETNRMVTIPHSFKECEETGRIDNFAIAGRVKKGKFRGNFYDDSDVFKVIEGAAYVLALHPDPKLEAYVDDVISKIACAQEPDGYLYTARTIRDSSYIPPGGQERWSSMQWGHELYNAGLLYEAGIAYFEATGKRTLLDVAIKNANLVCNVFGPGKKTSPCGHPEIEIALVKLYRQTGEEKYLNLAKFFVYERGRADGRELYGEYAQDHKPILEQTEVVGHSVRAAYLYSGVADVAALTGDTAYVTAIDRLWENLVGTKMYVTGGIGATGGIEGFGKEYELPNPNAYCETCAAIATAFWSQRMFLLKGDAKYVDVIERIIYNGFPSGVSMSGDLFFYTNPLESFYGASRSAWFRTACCPSNDVRFTPTIPGYAYAHQGNKLYVNLFIGGTATVKMDRQTVRLTQESQYPWNGTIKIKVNPDRSEQFQLCVRIPGWAQDHPFPSSLYRYTDTRETQVMIKINGKISKFSLEKGFAVLQREWKKEDVVELDLPVSVRRVVANEKVTEDHGRIALERGPIVFCLEGVDSKDGRVINYMITDTARLRSEFRKDLFGGVQTVRGSAMSVQRSIEGGLQLTSVGDFLAVPYCVWAHRGLSQMTVWPAREISAARPSPAPTIAATSKVTVSGGVSPEALSDQLEPKNSTDYSVPYFHWWPRKGTREWVQYDFAKKERVSSVSVYWFDDTGEGECRIPTSWHILFKDGNQWKPVSAESYRTAKDRINNATFVPVETDGLRLEVQLPEKYSTGIYEWTVK